MINIALTGDIQRDNSLRGTWQEYIYTAFSVRIQITIIRGYLIQNCRSTYRDLPAILNVANIVRLVTFRATDSFRFGTETSKFEQSVFTS